MHERGMFAPVVPEIENVDAARSAGGRRAGQPASSPIRCAVSLRCLPPDPATAERVAARLKLSNKARKRLASAADPSLGLGPQSLAYRLGTEGAVDRLLLAGRTDDARGHARLEAAAPADRRWRLDCPRRRRGSRSGAQRFAGLRMPGKRPASLTGEEFERLVAEALAREEHRLEEHRARFIAQRPADLRREGAIFRHLDLHLLADLEQLVGFQPASFTADVGDDHGMLAAVAVDQRSP